MRKAIEDIEAERRRQVTEEGWVSAHDDKHTLGEMARAAGSYALFSTLGRYEQKTMGIPGSWPWARSWWKPTDKRRDLVKAGALIVAEIERLDRAAKTDS